MNQLFIRGFWFLRMDLFGKYYSCQKSNNKIPIKGNKKIKCECFLNVNDWFIMNKLSG